MFRVRKIILLFLFSLCISCAQIPQNAEENYFEITDFKQGKMREESGKWIIYEEGGKLNYIENGECVYNRQSFPCMWYGFIMNYKTNQKKVVLNCKIISSEETNYGNPNELLDQTTDEYKFELPLDGTKTEFRNPQYTIGDPQSKNYLKMVTICQFQGEEVLNFTREIFVGIQSI